MDPKSAWEGVLGEVKKHISGKSDVIELMFIALVANGHILLEGMPGVAKTTMTKALCDAIDAQFSRIQGTPDLEPKDIMGYSYIDEETHKLMVRNGPIFTNILLIDELNRAPMKTTAGLLEVLEERQVTIPGAETQKLKEPFVAFATQNPISVDGTIQLPKVLTDRFLMKVLVSYPSMEEEQAMLRLKEKESKVVTKKVIGLNDILNMQRMASEDVEMPDNVVSYITRIVAATRTDMHVVLGGSPRAEISFMKAGKAKALIEGRKEVSIEDIKFLARPVLSHRIVVRSTGGVGVNGIIDGIIATLKE
jgi:MoxR-like ATPase